MDQEALEGRHWTVLLGAVLNGDCVLVIGPEVVDATIDGESRPVLEHLAAHIRGLLPEGKRPPAGTSFREVCQHYRLFAGPYGLSGEAIKFLRREAELDLKPLEDLAALPFPLIISTSPGLEFEAVLRKRKNKRPQTGYYNIKGAVEKALPEGSAERPLVYHLYGCVDDPTSLILSESDLLDFLVAVIAKAPPLPPSIRSQFSSRNKVFLFLGFGFKHWYLRILLHVLSNPGDNPSFALEHFDAIDHPDVRTHTLFFREGHKIHFFDMDLAEFAAELRARYEKVAGTGQRIAPAPAPGAPRVFLCHASEDAEFAENLSRDLRSEGLLTWLDKEQLRGGDKWDRLIQRYIRGRDHVDYFVVLQSRFMLERREGYVFREIAEALEREKELRDDQLKFVIPTFIDDHKECLDRLEHLQVEDLTAKDGVSRLASLIRRDQQRVERRK